MKHFIGIILLFSILLISGLAHGQEGHLPPPRVPGDIPQSAPQPFSIWSVEGTLGVSSCTGEDCKVDGGSMEPGGSFDLSGFYSLTRQFAVGLTLSGNGFSPNYDGAQPDKSSLIITSFLLEGRLYLPLSPQIRMLGLLAFGSTHYTFAVEAGGNELEIEDEGKALRIGAGIDFAITSNFSMGAILYYQANSWDLGKNDENGYPSDWNVIQAGLRFIYNF